MANLVKAEQKDLWQDCVGTASACCDFWMNISPIYRSGHVCQRDQSTVCGVNGTLHSYTNLSVCRWFLDIYAAHVCLFLSPKYSCKWQWTLLNPRCNHIIQKAHSIVYVFPPIAPSYGERGTMASERAQPA